MEEIAPVRTVDVVLFDGFELLDVFGPLELFCSLGDRFDVRLLGPEAEAVKSAQGPRVVADCSYDRASEPDIALVPGGIGTRMLVQEPTFRGWLSGWAARASIVASVCTGSGVLASAGLLDGYRATSNKRAFAWAREQGPKVNWIPKARWVEDRDRWTSSGVAAGMDMALALIARLHSDDVATSLADAVELHWHRDPAQDPFAVKHGLVSE